MALITLDFETYYDNDIGFSKLTTEEYIRHPQFEPLIVSLRLPSGEFVTQDLHDLTREQGRDFFMSHGVHESAVLAQNTRFDGAILNWHYGVTPKKYVDTMLMARAVLRHKTGGTSLAVIAEALGIGTKGTEVVNAKGKHRADFTDEEWAAYRAYCEQDVALTYLAFTLLGVSTPPRELKVMDSTLRWYIEPVLELNLPMLRDQVLNEQVEMNGHLKATGLTGKMLSSQPQFQAWLETQGIPCPMKPSPSNPQKMIPALAKSDPDFIALTKHHDPVIAAACKARLQAKSRIKETRMQRFVGIGERNNGKLPVPLLCYGAHTQRYAGDESINMQNLPLGIRAGIRAPDGYKIISADQAQIEARLNAVLSGQEDLVEGFRRGDDIYSEMATTIYNVPVSDGDGTNHRKVGKAIILGAGYGMGGERCYDFLTGQWGVTDVTREFSQQCIDVYRTKMWAIRDNWKTLNYGLQVMATGGEWQYGPVVFRAGEVELPSGMKLYYPDLTFDGSNYQYKRYARQQRKWNWVKIYGAMLMENLCQALARELLTEQILILEKKYRSVHQIHDEGWFVVPNEEVDVACQVMKKIMEMPPAWMPELPLEVEPSVAVSAADLK